MVLFEKDRSLKDVSPFLTKRGGKKWYRIDGKQ